MDAHDGDWPLGMILFWGLLIAGTVFLIRWFIGETVIKREDSALEILKKRYARGEINKQEFDERKKDLMG